MKPAKTVSIYGFKNRTIKILVRETGNFSLSKKEKFLTRIILPKMDVANFKICEGEILVSLHESIELKKLVVESITFPIEMTRKVGAVEMPVQDDAVEIDPVDDKSKITIGSLMTKEQLEEFRSLGQISDMVKE